jgi:outer membrane immunogenic protein
MRKLFLIGSAVTVMMATGSAGAADMPVKYTAPPSPPPTWTGFYAGINGGYGWYNNSPATFTANDPYSAALLGAGLQVGGGGQPVVAPANPIRGGFGGVQAGYNWQVTPVSRESVGVLVGIEADFQGSGIRGTGGATSTVSPPSLIATTTTEQKLRWFGTVRGRLGVLPTDNWLVYATGGVAYGQIARSVNVGFSGVIPAGTLVGLGNFSTACVLPGSPNAANCLVGASSRTSTGWTAGAGTEWRLARNLTFKAEYLYVRLGGDSFDVVSTAPPFNPGDSRTSFRASWGSTDFHALRIGLNYRFWDPPVVANY